jgi:hypothetical protein
MKLLLPFLLLSLLTSAQPKLSNKITNNTFWNTTTGTPIYSQGGGIFKFNNKYYWYGVQYKEAALYRQDPSITQSNATFENVTCYSSTDLVNWTFEANVLTQDELAKHTRKTWIGRLGVAYIKSINQYTLVVQCGSSVLFATSATPTGNFEWHNQVSMQDIIGTPNTGDQTVFTDDDGISYLIYSYGRGRNKIYVSEIGVKDGKVNLQDCKEIFKGESREGNCLFKYKGRYYMSASNIYGWDASFAYYLVADNIRGPYTPTNKMLVMKGCEADFAHVSQTGFYYTIHGTKEETVLYCGDRWADFAGNGLGYNQWVPLSFEGKENTPVFNSLSAWHLNATTGQWQIAADNNYVRNGSFEADRRHIPSPVKPLQDQLTGWETKVILGNAPSQDSVHSPVLNHFNSEVERKLVIGEKSAQISDQVPFERQLSQTIQSTPTVPLPNGKYTLTAKIRNSTGFSKLELYAFGQSRQSQAIGHCPEWTTISLKDISVRNGKLEIGIYAAGEANAFCLMDDVSLVRE